MAEELRRLHRLADDLAALSRTEEQRVELHPTRPILPILPSAQPAGFARSFSDAGVTLSVRGDAALPVHVDVDRVMQVLTNLLGNASDRPPPPAAQSR